MSVLLQVNGISKSYGATVILEDASASFSKYQKIGVIGRNGAGKSTLCKIIIGQEEADSGTIVRNSELRLAYLEQHDPYKPEESVIDFLTRYTGKEEWQCGEIAGRFQIKYEMLEMKIASLAGGFRTRVKLAAMLLRDPNFLILDEPTNYLDLSTLILLENFLVDFNGGYLIVSHDREFLKKTCDHTLEVENGIAELYPGGIEEYFEFKEEQLRQKIAYNKTVEKKKEQMQDFIDRFKAKASTATRAKSKMKQMEKLKTIEVAHPLDSVHIHIPEIERKAGLAVSCTDLAIGYPGRQVADKITFEVDRGSRVAILGDNGQGKTTWMRTIAGDLPVISGGYKWGSFLKIGYYAQHVFQTLHPEDDVYTHLSREAADGVSNQDILNMAGAFLFKGDDVKKKVRVLSGGERARLVLAGLLLNKCQVLLLDEPTNHLDFETVEALARSLKTFGGTLFFISHDRTFVNLIATSILEVKNGTVRKYPGTYEDYVYHLECEARDEHFTDGKSPKPEKHKKHKSPKNAQADGSEDGEDSDDSDTSVGPENPHATDKENRQELVQLKKKAEKLESRMKHNTQERDRLLKEVQENPFNYSKDRNIKMKAAQAAVDDDEKEWLALQSRIEDLKKKTGEN